MKKNQRVSAINFGINFGKNFFALSTAILFFSGCGEKPQQPPTPQTITSQPAPAKLFQQERSTLDKAKGVDQTTEKNSEQLRQEVDRQAP